VFFLVFVFGGGGGGGVGKLLVFRNRKCQDTNIKTLGTTSCGVEQWTVRFPVTREKFTGAGTSTPLPFFLNKLVTPVTTRYKG